MNDVPHPPSLIDDDDAAVNGFTMPSMQTQSIAEDSHRAHDQDAPTPIAPWWHTGCVLIVLGLWAALSGGRRHAYEAGPHSLTYLSQIMLSWMLFGTVIAGVLHRRAFFAGTIGDKLRAWRGDALRGLVVYAGIYGVAIAIAMMLGIGRLAYESMHSAKPAATTHAQTGAASATTVPPPPTSDPDPLAAFKNSRLKFDSKTVLALAPRTPLELLLWMFISITAGFCEEHIFRGYLLAQARAYTRLWGLSPAFATVVAVTIVSVIFGSMHLYEGVGGALVITCLGAVYAAVAIKLRNLRAVIVAHFLQDCIAGTMLFFLHAFYSKLLSP